MRQSSNLLKLPPEIRSLIYAYAVTAQHAVTFRLDAVQRHTYSEAVQPALTRVSRQVRAESLPIYYECNDFVLHTDGPKAEDALHWLRCNAPHLIDLRRLSLWLRYIALGTNLNHHLPSSYGALSVSIYRPTKGSDWTVDDRWRWITVMRKPAELDGDASFIITRLRGMTSSISNSMANPDDYMNLMMDIKRKYLLEKIV